MTDQLRMMYYSPVSFEGVKVTDFSKLDVYRNLVNFQHPSVEVNKTSDGEVESAILIEGGVVVGGLSRTFTPDIADSIARYSIEFYQRNGPVSYLKTFLVGKFFENGKSIPGAEIFASRNTLIYQCLREIGHTKDPFVVMNDGMVLGEFKLGHIRIF